MKKNILIICDPDERYLKRLDGFLRNALRIPFEIIAFTGEKSLSEFNNKEDALLIISETLFQTSALKGFKNILVLDEKPSHFADDGALFGSEKDLNIKHTGKYQNSEKLAESVLSMCLEIPELSSTGIRKSYKHKMRIVGFYTPDRNVLQTEISLEYACELGRKEKILYFSNDPFCIDKSIRSSENDENLSDLMYYSRCEDERFGIYLEKIVKKKRNLEYIPLPNVQIRDCAGEDYIRLLRKIEESGTYETLVVDFSEGFGNMQEVINMCDACIVLTNTKGRDEGSERVKLFRQNMEKLEGFETQKLFVHEVADGRELVAKTSAFMKSERRV